MMGKMVGIDFVVVGVVVVFVGVVNFGISRSR